jgi:hypothetical protein
MNKRFVFLTILALIIFCSCGTKESVKKNNDEDVLRERVIAYWNHKIKGEFDESYNYEEPFYRKKISRIRYIQSYGAARGEWLNAAIRDLKIEDESAKVAVNLRVKLIAAYLKGSDINAVLNEKWVKVDGIWYHVPEKSQAGVAN